MRYGQFLLLALAAACAPADESAPAVEGSNESVAATIGVTASDGQGCAATWNGAAVAADALAERAVDELERQITAGGGVEMIQEIPPFRIEAAPETPWRCVGPAMGGLHRGGASQVLLRPLGQREAPDHPADLPIPGMAGGDVPIRVLEIGPEGRMVWDGAAVDTRGLRERVRVNRAAVPRGDIVVSPAAEADFGAVYQAILHINADNDGRRVTIANCQRSAPTGGQGGALGVC